MKIKITRLKTKSKIHAESERYINLMKGFAQPKGYSMKATDANGNRVKMHWGGK